MVSRPGRRHGDGDLLYGDANPSGKLPITFPASSDATPFSGHPERSVGVNNEIDWSEGLDMGYRWYIDNNVEPLFPFGYGLSYTSFSYHGLSVTPDGNGNLTVSVTVKNTGKQAGATVAQVYVGPSANLPGYIQQTSRQLVQFGRVTLEPGASQQLTMTVTKRDLSSWDAKSQGWVLGTGKRTISVGSSAEDTVLKQIVTVS